MSRLRIISGFVALPFLAACSAPKTSSGSSLTCGFAALTAPLAVQEAFGRGQALDAAPWNPPDSLPVRMVAGPLFRGAVREEKEKSVWLVTVRDQLPASARTGFAVLVADGRGNNRGILLFDGPVIPGAPVLGSITLAGRAFPLIGVRMSSTAIEDPRCPIFGTPAK